MKANDLKLAIAIQKNDLLNKLLIVLTLLVLLAVLGSLIRAFELGWHNVMFVHMGILAILAVVTGFRAKIPYLYKAWVIVSLFFIAALTGLLTFGLASGNLGLWFSLPLFAAALVSFRAAVALIGLSMAIFAVVAWSSVHGLILTQVDYGKIGHSSTVWFSAITALPLFAYMPVLIINHLNTITQGLMDDLDSKNKELERLNTVKDTMFSVIAHDLRAPFNGLIGTLELIEDNSNVFDRIEKTKIFSGLLKDARSTHLMLENLLVWARSELQESAMDTKRHLLANLVSEACAPYRLIAQNKGIHVSVQVDPALEISCDAASIKIVLANLVSNAIKFSHSGLGINISAHRQADQLSISVEDSGIGLSPQQIEKILDTHQMYTTYGTSNEKGTGLGMKICQKLVRQNAGTLHIDSVAGKGSTVTIVLPMT